MKQKLTFLCVITICTLFNSCYVLQKSDDFFGIETSQLNTLYLIDISGSMAGVDEGSIKDKMIGEVGKKAGNTVSGVIGGKVGSVLGKQIKKESTKLGAVKRILIPTIKGLPDNKKFAVFAFESDVRKESRNFKIASNTARTTSSLFVTNLKAGGGTNTLKGLQQALSTNEVQEIILMSDGLPNGGPSKVLTEIRKINTKNIIIHTIAFGDDADINFMQTLAQENNGQFIISQML